MTAIFFTSVWIYSKKNNRRNVNPRWQNKNVKMSTRNDLRPYNFYHLYRDHDVPNRYQSFTLMLVHANYYRLYSTKKLSSLSLSLQLKRQNIRIERPTLMKSNVFVSITMQQAFSCQTIRQNSVTVFSMGPWVTM